ncbi:Crp/Fnr family transcriptional regulator [Flammeovirgaceae bacterium SG7u.111]|nr:Crp/Fnr family transcriptional regulator [Flammeovirgaceae bacterium SG7u.132]WPO38621.1 Crp/Fnr family transcriptional regulator [Flammeovirgaceae bacterium SG7u.111]
MYLDTELIKKQYPALAEPGLAEKIVEHGKLMSAKAGEDIIRFGSYVKFVPLVIQGKVKVMREDGEGNELFLYYLGEGETCAFSLNCCMRQEKSQIRATAEEETWLIAIPIRYMDEWTSTYPSWKNMVMMTFNYRFEELIKTVDAIAFLKMDERLERYLDERSRGLTPKVLNITHQEIATELNTSREVISRLLKQLEKHGKIKLGRNKISIN